MNKYYVAIFIFLSSCSKDDIGNMPPIEVNQTSIDAEGKILFISRRISNSADWQMVLMNADGSNQILVSDKLVRCAMPVLSNNKKKIAFTTYDENYYYNLYIVDTNGQNLQFLSRGKQYCGSPSWSPDDNAIAFVKNGNDAGGSYDIYLINVNGNNEIKLTHQNSNFSPRFLSNDDIIYSSSNGTWAGIFTVKRDGNGQKLLSPQNKSFSDPVVSPDKTKIAITSNDWNGSQIFVMNADGSHLKQITFTVSSKYFSAGYPRDGNCNPVWSPNSNAIAYVSYENGSPDIFKIYSTGIGNKRLTDTPLRDENPCWTSDGKYIIFSSNRNLNVSSEIYIMTAGGQLQTPLSNYFGDDIYPTFIDR